MNYLIFAITYALAASLQPGPFQAYIISQTLTKGWKKTFYIAFAPLIGDIAILILIFIILTNLPPYFINILRLIGGVFLLYLTYKTYLAWKHYTFSEKNENGIGTFFNAVMVNILNPNPYIGWSLVMGPMVLEIWSNSPPLALTFIFTFYFAMVSFTMGTIFLFSFARSLGPKISRILLGISAIGLFLFGFYQIYKGVRII